MASSPRGTLYTGVTTDLIQRVWQHREGIIGGFTRKYNVKHLVWYEQHSEMKSAISREKGIKKWKRAWKIELIEKNNPEWNDLWEDIVS